MQRVQKYIEDVQGNKIRTCDYVKLAVSRHLNDLKREDVYFDEEDAQFALDFFELLNLNTNVNDFKPFILEPFQAFIVANIFGWKRTENNRRKYNRAYIEIARKNGKTFFAAGVSLLMLIADGENSPQVFTGANNKTQAYICFKDAKDMVKASPSLKKIVKIRQFNMTTPESLYNGEYRYLSADASQHDGFRPYCVILDEIHEYKTNALYNIFSSAMGNRKQPLILMITTAGFNKSYWCYRDQRQFVTDVLEGKIQSDELFGIIYTLDAKDDPSDPENWIKSNPNLGVSVDEVYLREQVHLAEVKPSDKVGIVTKNFNVWMDADKIWIPSALWAKQKRLVADKSLKGLRVHGGADLSFTQDITCYTLCFTLPSGKKYLRHRFFVPKGSAYKRQKATGIPYLDWIEAGYMIACEGNTIDYNVLKKHILEDFEYFGVSTMGFDIYNATHLVQELNEVLGKVQVKIKDKVERIHRVYGISQHFKAISPTVKEFERMMYAPTPEIYHDGNPVMAWMLSNVVLRIDEDGNIKPDKGKSTEKIDGVISTIMALEQDRFWVDKEIMETSVYENRKAIIM